MRAQNSNGAYEIGIIAGIVTAVSGIAAAAHDSALFWLIVIAGLVYIGGTAMLWIRPHFKLLSGKHQ
jgi:hypothetical protein